MMNQIQLPSAKPIQLQWDGGKVVVTPEDQDRFVMEAGKAVASCQGMLAFERFFKQFQDEFLAHLHQWCGRNTSRVTACYALMPTGADMRVFVIGATPRMDFELSDMISDLELEFEEKGWRADIVQLPVSTNEMLMSFFNPAESIQVYGNSSRASDEGSSQLRLS
jgi:hypothetical protein